MLIREKMETKNEQTLVVPPTEYTYAILQETNEEEGEAWLYFIRYQGNEDALSHLNKQLEQVRWRLEEDVSTFDLELSYLVSEKTAKEMTKVDLNHYSFHRKFDGKLQKIDFGFKDTDRNSKKMTKVFDVLGYGDIEKFVDKEDIDPEDLVSHSQSSKSSDESDNESESDSEDEEKEKEKHKHHGKHGKMPGVIATEHKEVGHKSKKQIEIPRFAKAKKKHH